jgi:hypothetical protein
MNIRTSLPYVKEQTRIKKNDNQLFAKGKHGIIVIVSDCVVWKVKLPCA